MKKNIAIIMGGFSCEAAISLKSGQDDDGPLNGYADVNLPVSQEVYDTYDIGDKYCYD